MQIIQWNGSYVLTLLYIYIYIIVDYSWLCIYQMPIKTFTNVTLTKGFEKETHQRNV